jgi:hypothetical protein
MFDTEHTNNSNFYNIAHIEKGKYGAKFVSILKSFVTLITRK